MTGKTGTIGSAKVMAFTGASAPDWPANVFELKTCIITLSGSNTGTFTDQLIIPPASLTSTADTDYQAVYIFKSINVHGAPTYVSPIVQISSGTQIKHTDTGGLVTIPPIPAVDSKLVLSKTASPTSIPRGPVTFTLRMTNTGSNDSDFEDFVDLLPTSPGAVSYVAGSSSFNGAPHPDPVISGNALTWVSTFSVPAGQSRDLVFQASFPGVAGTYVNSATAHSGATQLDSTLATTDNVPATASVIVVPPDLTISKSHSGNFTQGQTGAAYTLTVSNSGIGPTAGTVTVIDTLPSGLTASAMSGTGWSCVLPTLTCTRNDALAAGKAIPPSL